MRRGNGINILDNYFTPDFKSIKMLNPQDYNPPSQVQPKGLHWQKLSHASLACTDASACWSTTHHLMQIHTHLFFQ